MERDIATVVARLSQYPSVSRIWLFGRAAKGEELDFRSDLDFAVEGLPLGEEFKVWTQLDATTGYPIDLVRFEEADDTLRSEILKWGRVIYEAA